MDSLKLCTMFDHIKSQQTISYKTHVLGKVKERETKVLLQCALTLYVCIKLTFRLLPYGRMSFGLFLVLLNIAACLVGKGVSMFTIDFGRKSENSESSKPASQSLYVVLAWICINILPQMLFVSKSDKTISAF